MTRSDDPRCRYPRIARIHRDDFEVGRRIGRRQEVSLSTRTKESKKHGFLRVADVARLSDRTLLIYPESEIHDKQVSP